MNQEYKDFGPFEYLGKNTVTGNYQTIKSKNELSIGQVVLDQSGVEYIIIEKI